MSTPPIRFTVNGKKWVIEIEDRDGLWGECDLETGRITLHSVLRNATRKRLEILIHEVIHACFPDASEESVTEAGKVLSSVCWQDGWRRQMASIKGRGKRGARSVRHQGRTVGAAFPAPQ